MAFSFTTTEAARSSQSQLRQAPALLTAVRPRRSHSSYLSQDYGRHQKERLIKSLAAGTGGKKGDERVEEMRKRKRSQQQHAIKAEEPLATRNARISERAGCSGV
jgi:hypothetical protein